MTGQGQTHSDCRAFDGSETLLPLPSDSASPSAIGADLPEADQLHALQEQLRPLVEQNAFLHLRASRAEGAMRRSEAEIDRMKEHLAYRLGTEMIAATRSLTGFVGLPLALIRAYREFKIGAEISPQPQSGDPQTLPLEADGLDATGGPDPASDDAIDTSTPAKLAGRIAALRAENAALLERAVAADRIRRRSDDTASHLHEHLAYRIGTELVGVRTLPAVLKLPFSLRRAYRDFKNVRSPKTGRPGPRSLGIVGDLEAKLWGGFARYALPELERCIGDHSLTPWKRSIAAHALARWHFVEGDFSLGADLMAQSIALSRDNLREKRLCQLMCLAQAGRADEADALINEKLSRLDRFIDFSILHADVLRRKAMADGLTIDATDRIYLDALNLALAPSGMSPIELADPSRPLSIWNIVSHPPESQAMQAAKVSIIVPAFNAEKTLTMVLESLAAQTWRNLEVIVVDDCSADGTCDLVEAFAAKDPRIRLLRRVVNGGAYPARNDGVEVATGDYITVCDSDDWSHPEKIERQVNELLAKPDCVAVLSHWLRVDDNLGVVGSWIPKKSILDMNFSSLLVRREVFGRMRGWDEVRVTGDAEFRARILAAYGDGSICKVRHNNVLSLSLAREDSLTRSKATHMRSLFHGVRGQYRDSYRHWHLDISNGADPFLPRANGRYPVPLGNRRTSEGERRFDLVVICDFVLKGGAFVSTMNYLAAAARAGLRIGAVHWRKYELSTDSPLNPMFYEACLKHGIAILTPGDHVKASHVLVGYPAVLQHLPDRFPQIDADNVIVLINQFATRLIDGSDRQYEPEVARGHLIELFGTSGTWIPISHWVKRLMQDDPTYPEPYALPWHPMLDVEAWCTAPIRWRAGGDRRPVLGRHGRDAYTKWPSTLDALKAAYGVEADVDVKFLGGAKHARGMLGFSPQNWDVQHFDATPVSTFLENLDFFIHFPHELYIEEFGRAPMEAMAVGKVVILPPQFEETFGDAAVYCTPGEVLETVHRFWNDEAAYLAQAAKGRDFVIRHCNQRDFIARLEALNARPNAAQRNSPAP